MRLKHLLVFFLGSVWEKALWYDSLFVPVKVSLTISILGYDFTFLAM